MPPAAATSLVPLGVVIGAHGLRGELRVKPYNPTSDLLLSLPRVHVRRPDQAGAPERALQRARWHGTIVVLTLADCADRDAAEALRGAELCVERAALPALPEGQHYLIDLVGLEARLPNGSVVGTVQDALEYPASCALRIPSRRGMLEVPLLEPYVLEVRAEERVVIVDRLDDLEPTRDS